MQYHTVAVFLLISFTGLINAQQYQNEVEQYNGGSGKEDASVNSEYGQSMYSQETKNPVIDVNGEMMPITIRFNTQSSPINAVQNHIKHTGKVQKSSIQEEPNVLYLTVEKPINQVVREIISPRREVIRTITPTREVVKTVVASSHNNRASGGGGNGGMNNNYNDNNSQRGHGGNGGGRDGQSYMRPYQRQSEEHLSNSDSSVADSTSQ